MDGLTLQIFNWLTQIGEKKSADFISNCTIETNQSQWVSDACDFTVFVPLKTFKILSRHKVITIKIENVIKDFADSNSYSVNFIDWKGKLMSESELQSNKRGEIITGLLTEEYVSKQVKLMNQSVNDNPHLAIGTAKELIETCCKSILTDKGILFDKDWDIQKLVKETNKNISLLTIDCSKNEITKSAVSKILSGFSNIVHGITELRNNYGTGHGHNPNFEMLDNLYVKLAVSSASELAIFYLTIHSIENNKID